MKEKNCVLCGRTIEYRKKWKNNWDDIKYCSELCRNNKSDLSKSDNYEILILKRLSEISIESTICPSEILPPHEKSNKMLMEKVRQAARRLVHKGEIEITQKGQVIDPSQFKGPIRLRKMKKSL